MARNAAKFAIDLDRFDMIGLNWCILVRWGLFVNWCIVAFIVLIYGVWGRFDTNLT